MRWIRCIRNVLPVSFAVFVAWWLGTVQRPRATLLVPGNDDSADRCWLLISPHGKFLVSSPRASVYIREGPPETVQFWDLESGQLCASQTKDYDDLWYAGTFSPDDQWLAVPIKKSKVRLWNSATGKREVEYALRPNGNRWRWDSRFAYTKSGKLVDFCEGDEETTCAYEVDSGCELFRLPKGHVTPLVADIVLHSYQGHLRLFRLDEGLDLSKPFMQNPFERMTFDKNGEIESSFGMGHSFRGCTHAGNVLFGTFRLGGAMSSTYCFYRDFDRNIADEIDSDWGEAFLCPSWTGKYVVKTQVTAEASRLPDWLQKWLPNSTARSLILHDYDTKERLLAIPNGISAVFSHDDRVMAVYVGNRKIQIWDLPLSLPWLSMLIGAVAAWAGSFLVIQWGIRRSRAPRQTADVGETTKSVSDQATALETRKT